MHLPMIYDLETHRNQLEPIEHSTDQPVLKLLHNVAHAGLEIPSTSPNHQSEFAAS